MLPRDVGYLSLEMPLMCRCECTFGFQLMLSDLERINLPTATDFRYPCHLKVHVSAKGCEDFRREMNT